MLKSASQMHFQQLSQNLQKQLDITLDRLVRITTIDKLTHHQHTYSQLNTKIKNINNVYSKIEIQMKINMKNKNYNQYDLKNKLRNYALARDKLIDKYAKVGKQIENVKSNYLFNQAKQGMRDSQINRKDVEMKNISKVNQLMSRYNGINNDLNETEQVTTAWMPELHNQGKVIDQMRVDARQAEAELSMADQMMRIIKNRNLMTKCILIILIIFMGIADILLLAVKLF